MKGLKILVAFGFLLLVIGLQASAPPGDIERDVTRIEASADYTIVPVFDMNVLTMEFVEDYTYIQEGRVDDYSTTVFNRFTEPFRMADNLFNIEYNAREFLLIKNEESQFLNTDYKPPVANRPLVWLSFDDNLYSNSRPYYNPHFPEVLIC